MKYGLTIDLSIIGYSGVISGKHCNRGPRSWNVEVREVRRERYKISWSVLSNVRKASVGWL